MQNIEELAQSERTGLYIETRACPLVTSVVTKQKFKKIYMINNESYTYNHVLKEIEPEGNCG